MSDFSDRPFVAGSLVGLRAFAIDAHGRLHGPSYDSVFRPGENVATCRKPVETDDGWSYYMPGGLVSSSVASGSSKWFIQPNYPSLSDEPLALAAVESAEEFVHEEPPHHVGAKDCTCGFYAYFDGRNDYLRASSSTPGGWRVTFGGMGGTTSSSDRIAAIVEGYGICTVGSRGFRAEKARLLGLILPDGTASPLKVDLVVRNYPDVDLFTDQKLALEEYPLTVPDVPGPDSLGFWDRPVSA